MRTRIVLSLILLLTAAFLTGCNPGGGIGGTGKQVTSDGLVIGVVDGFGSIIINDNRFETDSAIISIDGNNAQLLDLKVGMKVQARVSSADNQAVEIYYQPNASGPVSQMDTDAYSFEILGQQVLITNDTVLDDLTLSELTENTVVEVSGDRDVWNNIVARYIRRPYNDATIYTTGTVELSADGQRVFIGGVEITFTEAALSVGLSEEQFAERYLVPGSVVRISSTDAQQTVNVDGGNGGDSGDAVDGNTGDGGDGGDAINGNGGDGGDSGDAVNGNTGDGGDGGDAINGTGGNGGDSGDAVNGNTGDSGDGGDGGDATNGSDGFGFALSGDVGISILSAMPVTPAPLQENDSVEILGTIYSIAPDQVISMEGIDIEFTSDTQVLTAFETPVDLDQITENQTVMITGVVQNGSVVAEIIELLEMF